MNRRKSQLIGALTGAFFGFLLLGSSDTVRAQTVTLTGVDPTTLTGGNTLNVTVKQGGVSAVQNVQVTTNEGITQVQSTVNLSVNPAGSWLQVAQAPGGTGSVNTQATLQITVNGANLTQGAPVSGTITITPASAPSNAVVLTVNVTVSGTSLLSSNPPSLSFSAPVGTAESDVPTQQLTISSSGAQLGYTVSASTQDGHPWLIPFTTSGNTGNSSTDVVNVGVNPAGLSAGPYQGTITVQSTTTSDAVAINVAFTITAGATLSVTPSTLPPFLYQIGSTPQQGQLTETLQVSSTPASATFQVTANPQVPWLVISPTSSATGIGGVGVAVTLSVNPQGLTAAVYNTSVTVSILGGASLPAIPVQLVVSNNPLLNLSANTLSFASSFGATTAPPLQAVQVTTVGSSSTPVGFTVKSDSSWLTGTASTQSTPATINVTANPTGLAVNTYTGHLTVTPNNSDANLYSLTVTATFVIGNVAQVTAGPPLLVFSWETSQPRPPSQVVELFTTGQATTFTLSTSSTQSSSCPPNWLSATANNLATPTITVSANITGMTPGICPGTVTVSYPAGSQSPQTLSIPVSVNVSNSALLNISLPLGFGNVTTPQGSGQIIQNITLTSTDPNVQVTDIAASASNSGPAFLFLGQNGNSTPQQLQVVIQPGSLTPYTYSGSVSISSSKLPSSPLTIPVTLTVTSNTTVTVAPLTLTFNQALGGPPPASQQVTLTSSASGATFQTSIPNNEVCSWLQVSPTSGAASGPVNFTVLQNSLASNMYQCPVTFSFLNSASAPISVLATLTVGPAQTLMATPSSLTFTYQIGGSAPAAQPLTLISTGGPVQFTAAAASSGNWLSIDSTSGTTGGSNLSKVINVSVDPTKFPSSTQAGASLPGTITISAPGVLANPATVNVTVNVVAASAPVPVTITTSAQPANGFGAIAPGEIITIRGTNLGPANCSPPAACLFGGYTFTVGSNGTVSSTLGGVQVLFDNTPGTPTYVSATQINVIVPWEIAGRASTNMAVAYNNVESAVFPLNVAAVAPGIYTQDASGSGQAAVVNLSSQAASIYNGPAGGTYYGTSIATAPAPQGSAIVLYLTGGGLTSPALADGSVAPATSLTPLKGWTPGSSYVTATVGGQPATVIFAGAAPTLISGAVQINLQLPAGVTGNNVAVQVTIDGVPSNTVSIAVQ